MSTTLENPGKTPITNSQDQMEEAEVDTTDGPQDVNNAPAEDPASNPVSDDKTALKGKKVDGDPTDRKDQPLGEEK